MDVEDCRRRIIRLACVSVVMVVVFSAVLGRIINDRNARIIELQQQNNELIIQLGQAQQEIAELEQRLKEAGHGEQVMP